jgi:hypothetical protein
MSVVVGEQPATEIEVKLCWYQLEWVDPDGTLTEASVGDRADARAGWTSRGCGDWVLAAPFRAHVRHLITASGLAWRTVALLAGVPAAAMDRLLHGRGRRHQQRMDPVLAGRLFQLTSKDLAAARMQTMPVAVCRAALLDLARSGWAATEIAWRANLSPAQLNAIAGGQQAQCTRAIGATILAAAQALANPSAGSRSACQLSAA